MAMDQYLPHQEDNVNVLAVAMNKPISQEPPCAQINCPKCGKPMIKN
ncbi:MAG: hypothetical protein RBT65_13460 [Methanolobus sp.]|nr:hypothetical protein [Methanolobus sp.]